jgi:hypothetical protein
VTFAWDIFAREKNDDEASAFRDTFSRSIPIEFIGVWDTVSSVRYSGRDQHFPYTFDNPIVHTIRQALALDERRAYFRQNLWKEPARAGQDVRQVWFAGVHCDVGGGYKESECGLSKIALKWMMDAIGAKLAFDPAAVSAMIPTVSSHRYAAPDVAAKIHESLRGAWHFVEFIPRRAHVRQPDGSYQSHWILPRGHCRWVDPIVQIHPSVYERTRLVPGYRPLNLPVAPLSATPVG